MAKSLEALEWDVIQAELRLRTRSPLGAGVAQSHVPYRSAMEAHNLQQRVSECFHLIKPPQIWPLLADTVDPAAAFEALKKDAVLQPSDIWGCGHFFETVGQLGGALRTLKKNAPKTAPLLIHDWDGAPSTPDVCERIRRSCTSDGAILDTASQELSRLRTLRGSKRASFESMFESKLRDYGSRGVLQDKFYDLVDGRYVIPVKASEQSKVPGAILGKSNTGQSVFIEPAEFTAANNELKEIEIAIQAEEFKILRELSKLIGALAPDFRPWIDAVALLDLSFAAAQLASEWDLHPATTSDQLSLKNLFHPALMLREEYAKGTRKIISNTFDLPAKGQALILSGPNTGGKTVLLKAAGIATNMHRAGLFVPAAPGSTVPHYSEVFALIGDDQSLSKGLSSFSAQIRDMKSVIESRTSPNLILIDEILSSTDPEEASALAQSIVEELLRRKHHVILTTHFAELSLRARANPAVRLSGMEFKNGEPTYRLLTDELGSSHAIEVAERLGLPRELTARAKTLVSEHKRGYDDARAALSAKESELQDAHARAVRNMNEDKSALKLRYEIRIRELEQKLALFLETSKKTLEDKIFELSRRLSAQARTNSIPRNSAEKLKNEVSVAVDELADDALVEFQGTALQREREKIVATQFETGMPVRVRSMGLSPGTILSVDEAKKTAIVQIGSFRLEKQLGDLETDQKAVERAKAKQKNLAGGGGLGHIDFGATSPGAKLDLRGKRLDDALAEFERYIDQAFRARLQQVTIITGHGTGAIKLQVRERLKSLPYIREWRPERQNDDGAIVIDFDL